MIIIYSILIAIFCSLAVKIAGIYCVKNVLAEFQSSIILLIVPAYSRASMLFGIRYFKYGRDVGTGRDLFKKKLPIEDFLFLAIPIILSFSLGIRGLIINGAFALSVFLILWFYKKKMGCITGDMLGAMCEITESVLFLVAGMSLL
ncbi:MAG: adenosylcobinamide-GDP ribazoletransferase [Desulfamplus sp.]|nr:adenosylcobinamide-GDP ribazoletransferase [Desulfamplus sp.]